MDLRDVCIICGIGSDEADMIETEDGWICIHCAGDNIEIPEEIDDVEGKFAILNDEETTTDS